MDECAEEREEEEERESEETFCDSTFAFSFVTWSVAIVLEPEDEEREGKDEKELGGELLLPVEYNIVSN